MAYTMADIRAELTRAELDGERVEYASDYMNSPLLRHFKAGVNASLRPSRDWSLDMDVYVDRYASAHGGGDDVWSAFHDGWIYAAAYL